MSFFSCFLGHKLILRTTLRFILLLPTVHPPPATVLASSVITLPLIENAFLYSRNIPAGSRTLRPGAGPRCGFSISGVFTWEQSVSSLRVFPFGPPFSSPSCWR